MLDAVGGFVDGEETFEDSLAREIKEEIGLEPSEYETPQYLTSAVGHYQFGGETVTVLTSLFWARLKTSRTLMPTDDVADLRTLHPRDINLDEVHDDDIRTGIEHLRLLFP
jgi:ADP-ribose pyrophosphatase YjhB (NUDIX family)